MKLLLRESIRGVGKRGDVVDVTDGYARNYLLPRQLALPANEENLRKLAGEKRAYEARLANEKEQAQEIAAAITKLQLSIPMNASPEGQLYGSVSPKVIVDALKEEGISLRSQQVTLESDNIRELGTYAFKVQLHDEVEVESRVWIVEAKN
jgi:large subunit ribosomal protein L9